MLKRFLSLCVLGSFVFVAGGLDAHAQASVTRLGRQLERVDIALSGIATLTKGVSGENYLNQSVTQNASTSLGGLVQVRYIKSPFIGFEGNYSYARYAQDYSIAPGGVQNAVSEYTLGYVAHLPSLFGVEPFASVGAGSTEFSPTAHGGQGLPARARATYYYSVGVDDQFLPHFGFRAQFRQLFYKAPDFGQNYLAIDQQTITSEPSVGVYFKF